MISLPEPGAVYLETSEGKQGFRDERQALQSPTLRLSKPQTSLDQDECFCVQAFELTPKNVAQWFHAFKVLKGRIQ
jgi:hypothetical protein